MEKSYLEWGTLEIVFYIGIVDSLGLTKLAISVTANKLRHPLQRFFNVGQTGGVAAADKALSLFSKEAAGHYHHPFLDKKFLGELV